MNIFLVFFYQYFEKTGKLTLTILQNVQSNIIFRVQIYAYESKQRLRFSCVYASTTIYFAINCTQMHQNVGTALDTVRSGSSMFRRRRFGAGHFVAGYFGAGHFGAGHFDTGHFGDGTIGRQNFFF